MAKVTVRKETGKLVMDFTYCNVRCREQTALPDTLQNRKRVEAVLEKIKKALKNGTFQYRDYFPESALASRFDQATTVDAGSRTCRRAWSRTRWPWRGGAAGRLLG